MCARLYLNGDGMGKGTHVSLFFVVMRGMYDALLKWPFRQKVWIVFVVVELPVTFHCQLEQCDGDSTVDHMQYRCLKPGCKTNSQKNAAARERDVLFQFSP